MSRFRHGLRNSISEAKQLAHNRKHYPRSLCRGLSKLGGIIHEKREAIDARNMLDNAIYQADKMKLDNKDKISEEDVKVLDEAIRCKNPKRMFIQSF